MNLYSKHMIGNVLLLLFAVQMVQAADPTNSFREHIANALKSTYWQAYRPLFESGSMNGYFTLEEAYEFITYYKEKFPMLIFNLTEIGQSYEKRPIYAFGITEIGNRNQTDPESFREKGMMLFTGAHHAREPISVSMNLYVLAKLVFLYNSNEAKIIDILRHNVIWIIPVVNVDGYKRVVETYGRVFPHPWVRKNRHPSPRVFCASEDIGVDLNRNYEYQFAKDNIGSGTDPCSEDYRGEHAFSESETVAVRDFILKFQERLGVVINFHAWGNLWIIPFNYDSTGNPLKKNHTLWDIYENFRVKSGLHGRVVLGNAKQTINYVANGEASDWVTGRVGILSFSPELGSTNTSSDDFFTPKATFWAILEENFPPLLYLLHLLATNISIDYTREYRIYDPVTKILHSSLFPETNSSQTTFGIQIYNEALTGADYAIGFNVTYTGLSNQSQVPTVVLTSYDYDLDSYTNIIEKLSKNSSRTFKTDGLSKHIDFLNIPDRTTQITLSNTTIIDEKNNTIISYYSLNTKKTKRMLYQKLYFTLVSDTPVYASKCKLSLQINSKQQPLLSYQQDVFSDAIRPYQQEEKKDERLTNILYFLIYLVSASLTVLIGIYVYRCIRRSSEQKYVSEVSEGSDGSEGRTDPHIRFHGENFEVENQA